MPLLTIETVFLIVSVLLILSVIASKFSDRFGIPSLVLFLIIGMLAGSEGIGGIYFDNPHAAQAVGVSALVIILFSGGLDTRWENIRGVLPESLSLATVGVLLTALITGLAAHLILNISLLEGLLIGAIASSTDAAAVFALLRSQGVRLKGKLSTVLEFESGSNDPMAVFLTIGLIQLILNPGQTWQNLLILFVQQMAIGGLMGIAFGMILLYLINRLKLGYEGLYPVLTMGVLLMAFATTAQLNGSGFLAVYIIGLLLGREDFLHKRSLSRFYDGLAWLSQIFMFLTLGLLVFPSQLIPVIIPGMVLAGVLIFLSRPLSVMVSLLPFKYSMREKNMIAWVGLRGAVPIILATYPRIAGMDETGLIFNLVFFIVLTSVLVQGTTIPWLTRWLKLDDPADIEALYPLEMTPLKGWKAVLREVVISKDSPLVGKAIFEMKLPNDYLVVLISRGDKFIIPNGSAVLNANDRMLGLAKPETHERVRELTLSGIPPADPLVRQ